MRSRSHAAFVVSHFLGWRIVAVLRYDNVFALTSSYSEWLVVMKRQTGLLNLIGTPSLLQRCHSYGVPVAPEARHICSMPRSKKIPLELR